MEPETKVKAGFSSLEQGQLIEQPPANWGAWIGLILAIASVLAVAHPLFLVVPLLAIVAGVIGLRTATVTEGGRKVAMIAVCVAAFFAGWAPAQLYYTSYTLKSKSQKVCEDWLKLFQDNQYGVAHQATLQYEDRLAPGASIDQYYAAPDPDNPLDYPSREDPEESYTTSPHEKLQDYLREATVSRLIAFDGEFDFKYLGNISSRETSQSQIVFEQEFEITGSQDGQEESWHAVIETQRFVENGEGYWQILDFKSS